MYDPQHHADKLGLKVIEGNPGHGLRGRWIGNQTIILRPGLTWIQHRCTLAHEIVHAEYDPPLIPHHLSAKAEARADRIAALRLIDHQDFIDVARIYDSLPQLAYELGVTPKILTTYLETSHEENHGQS
ncbi:ImmA/IrrE family metallo-endopeptidase [Rothia sp. LK2588]|uniref:ImmA/IrrE family metallo-endopeptidase n=1 Tax=Rothia sp. LK2588 TaxID=3114369 RepID=UPI0034CF74B1